VPAEAIAYANRLLPLLATGLTPATSIRTADGGLRVRHVADGLPAAVVDEARAALREEGSIGVIVADVAVPALDAALTAAGVDHAVLGEAEESDDEYATPDARVSLVPATLAKGLEFDHVVVVEPEGIVLAEPRGLRRLYVALTRAVSRLVVLHLDPLPEPLAA
jgi:DNA helicase IV